MNKNTIYIKQWRIQNKLTQAQLAKKSKLPQAAISKIENGHREITTKTILKLCAALNLPPARLFVLPPSNIGVLGRQEIDNLARAVVDGKNIKDPAKRQLCEDVSSLLINKLKAHKKMGARRNNAKRWNVLSRYAKLKQIYSEEILKQILCRADKLLS